MGEICPQSPGEAHRREGQTRLPCSCPYAAPFLRLCPGQCGARHNSYPGLAWSQVYSAYSPVHGTDADQVQGLLALGASAAYGLEHEAGTTIRQCVAVVWRLSSHCIPYQCSERSAPTNRRDNHSRLSVVGN